MKKVGLYLLKTVWYMFATLIILFALFTTAARIVLPHLHINHQKLIRLTSEVMHQPVKVAHAHAEWVGFEPVIQFRDVEILDSKKTQALITVKRLQVGFDLFETLRNRRLVLGTIIASGAKLTVHQDKQGGLHINGIKGLASLPERTGGKRTPSKVMSFMEWLLSQGEISLHDFRVTFQDKSNKIWHLNNLNLGLNNTIFHHRLSGSFDLEKQVGTKAKFSLTIYEGLLSDQHHQAEVYLHLKNVDLKKWLAEYQYHGIKANDGISNLSLWAHWQDGQIKMVQTIAHAKNVSVLGAHGETYFFKRFAGHIMWLKTNDSWRLTATDLQLAVSGSVVPGIDNLTGHLQFTSTSGEAVLHANEAMLKYPIYFRSSVPVQTLSAVLSWHKANGAWDVSAQHVLFVNHDGSAVGDARLLLPKKAVPNLRMLFNFHARHLSKIPQYLSEKQVHKGLLRWFDQAIVKGDSAVGTVLFDGPVNKFPFAQREGRFLFNADLKDVDLRYRKGWPVMRGVYAKLAIDNNALTLNETKGTVMGANIVNANVQIPDLRKPLLQAQGRVEGHISQGVDFVMHSPLKKTIGHYFKVMSVSGPMHLQLRLNLPLKNSLGERKVWGRLKLPYNQIALPRWNINVKQLKGNLEFTQNSLAAKRITGEMLGQPVEMHVATLSKAQHQMTHVYLGGSMPISALQRHFRWQFLSHLHGKTNYRAIFQLEKKNETSLSKLNVLTDLRGVSVDLPAPFNKTAQQPKSFHLVLRVSEAEPLRLLLQYDNLFTSALTFDKDHDMKLASGEVHFGQGRAKFQKQPGVLISGYLNKLTWQQWLDLHHLLGQHSSKATHSSKKLLRKVELKIGQFSGFFQSLNNVRIQLMPQQAAWALRLNSKNVSGQLTIPYAYPSGLLRGNFSKLVIVKSHAHKKAKHIKLTDFPAFNFLVRSLRYHGKLFGGVQIAAQPVGNAIRINKLTAVAPAFNLVANGVWSSTKGVSHSAFAGYIKSKNLGALLQMWGLSSSIVSGRGMSTFNLKWHGAPYDFDTKTMSGQVALQFFNGRIIHLGKKADEEMGIGTILNIFSLQTLTRRLHLDFSDLTEKGFSFDIFRGGFELREGVATTSNAYLDGPVAKIDVRGGVNIPKKRYNLYLLVSPHVTSSLPVVATIIGTPIVGALTWVADKIFGPEVDAMTSMQYKVAGPWGKPVITKISHAS